MVPTPWGCNCSPPRETGDRRTKERQTSRSGSCHGLPPEGHALGNPLEALPAFLRAHDDSLNVSHHVRILRFFAQLFQERMNLREDEKHLAGKGRLEEKFFIQRALEH